MATSRKQIETMRQCHTYQEKRSQKQLPGQYFYVLAPPGRLIQDVSIMPIRFRRSIKIFPGVRLNFSKSGVSTSVGIRGAHVTLGKTDRVTIGLPNTGLSDTEIIRKTSEPKTGARALSWALIIFIAMIFAVSWLLHSASA